MTVTTHSYAAYLIGSPDELLDVRDGRITLDAGQAPHVECSLTVVADAEVRELLDPRLMPRVRIEVDALTPTGAQYREFNLGVRDMSAPQSDSTVSLTLASDEAILTDYAPLADDATPWTLQGSLVDIVDYVLTEAAGASLEPGAPDPDMTSYWDSQNQFTNPSVEVDLPPWEEAGNCDLFFSTPWGDAPAGTTACGITSQAANTMGIAPEGVADRRNVVQGKEYTVSGYGRMFGATARTITACLRWHDINDYPRWADLESTPVSLSDSAWSRVHISAIAPEGAVKAFAFFRIYGSTAGGQICYIDCAMFNDGPLIEYIDGTRVDTAEYAYDWDGDAYASTSRRVALVDSPQPDAFTWRAGQPAIDFLSPLVQAAGLRLVCDELRQWTLRDEEYTAPGSLNIRYGVNLIEGSDTISRDSGLWFDAAVTRYTWNNANGITQEKLDTYSSGTPTLVKLFERDTPYPGPGFSQYAVRRAQGRGRELSATRVSDWIGAAEQPVTVILQDTPTQTGITQRVEFDLSNDRMTITTRTLDTPSAAWVLIPVDETWLDQTIGESWTEEVI